MRARKTDELSKVKRDLKKLRSAIPPLKSPQDLLRSIVKASQEVMYCCSSLSQLRDDIRQAAKERGGDWERSVQVLELKNENCELRFLGLRHYLRTLHASAPILIATGKMSEATWNTMLEQPHHYTDAKGKKQVLMVRVDAMERILSDQIDATKDVYAELRALRTTKNQHQQEENDSDHQKLMNMLNIVLQSIEELTKKVENR
ncbi:hypothetical protein GCK32_016716, partial [Trichostrongylus colubriformis]